MKIKNLKLKILLLYITCYTLLVTPVHAVSPTPGVDIREYFGFGNIGSLGEVTTRLVGPIFQIATVLVIAYFLVGAFKYLKAESNKEEVEGARQMIIHAIVGFLILMFAFLVLQFLLSSLFRITTFQIIGNK